MTTIIWPLGRSTPRQLVEEIFFFNSWKQVSSLLVHRQGLVFFIRSVRGAHECVKLYIWRRKKLQALIKLRTSWRPFLVSLRISMSCRGCILDAAGFHQPYPTSKPRYSISSRMNSHFSSLMRRWVSRQTMNILVGGGYDPPVY